MNHATTSILSDTRYNPVIRPESPRQVVSAAGRTERQFDYLALRCFALPRDNMFYPGTVVCRGGICCRLEFVLGQRVREGQHLNSCKKPSTPLGKSPPEPRIVGRRWPVPPRSSKLSPT